MLFTMIRPAVLLAVAGVALPLPAAHAESFEGRDICRCYVTSLSADGTAATGQLNGSYQTFYWTWQGGMRPLGRGTQRKLKTSAGTPARPTARWWPRRSWTRARSTARKAAGRPRPAGNS